MLTFSQIIFYIENGYLVVSGLIPDDIVVRSEQAMWNCMGLDIHKPHDWPGSFSGSAVYTDEDLIKVYTEEFLTAAWQLSQGDVERANFVRPRAGFAINTFPSEEEWRPHGPHLDHAIKEHGHKTFPQAFRIASMVFLNKVSLHGGGTIVWPESHKKMEALSRSNPDHYHLMWTLNNDLNKVDIGEYIELAPKAGDILFYHPLCVHSGSINNGKIPRLAMNMKW
jgi:hypothetical protein